MEWLAHNWLLVVVFLYAMASEIVGESNLPQNSIVRIIFNGIGAGIRAVTGQLRGEKK